MILYDEQDKELVEQFKWCVNKDGYAHNTRCGKVHGTTYMHRLIASNPKGKIVDHINGNKLDNRRENLRICDRRINAINVKKQKGIHWYKAYQKWQVYIWVDSKKINLGYYELYDEALEVRKKAEQEYHKPILERGELLV